MCFKINRNFFSFLLTEEIAGALLDVCKRWCKRDEHVESNALKALKPNIFRIIEKQNFILLQKFPPKPRFTFRRLKKSVHGFQKSVCKLLWIMLLDIDKEDLFNVEYDKHQT